VVAEQEDAADYPAVRARVLAESLAAGLVLVVGEAPAAKELVAVDPDRFALDGAAPGPAPPGGVDVLALSLDAEVLERARTVAAGHGREVVHALVEPAGEAEPVAALRAQLAARGLVLVGLRRVFWPVEQGDRRRSRARRIDEETRGLLLWLVADGSGTASALLGEELARLERELAVAVELRVEQQMARAATEHRLEEATGRIQRLEADRRRLEQELSRLQAALARTAGELEGARHRLAEAARELRRRRWAPLRRMLGR
jgi:hypothetical protein